MDIIKNIKECKSLSGCIRMINRNENIYELIKNETSFLENN